MSIKKISAFIFLTILFSCNLQDKSNKVALATTSSVIKSEELNLNLIFQSVDGGETWTDVSRGLEKDIRSDVLIDNDFLYLSAGNTLFSSQRSTGLPIWQEKMKLESNSNIAINQAGIFAFNSKGHVSSNIANMHVWLPMYPSLPTNNRIHCMFDSEESSFIGCEIGIFKTNDKGKTWKQVNDQGWVRKMIKSNGVILATSQIGILRSEDNGEHWQCVINEGGVGIAIEQIKDGFAAITYNTDLKTRRIRTSFDGGKTWQAVDNNLPPHASISSIIQSGKSYFCGHPEGIFRSQDYGKTWQLILPSIDKKVFNLSVAGDVIYAIPMNSGC